VEFYLLPSSVYYLTWIRDKSLCFHKRRKHLEIGIEETVEWLKSLGAWAIIASVLLNIMIGSAGVIPTVFLSAANAVVFGMVPGFVISLIGECLSAIVSFYLYRWGILKFSNRKAEGRFWNKLGTLREQSRIRMMIIVLFARMTPFIPSGLVTLAAAISGMKIIDFTIVTVLGKIPSIAVETIIGHDLFYMRDHWFRISITLLFIGIMVVIMRRPRRERKK
jgi:uncharacterized membrane protein YdjX (TVP38/TMEM64 family)